MIDYLYTAWFRCNYLLPEDQDYEWPACFVIVASTAEDAQTWGDRLAQNYANRSGEEIFLYSNVECCSSQESMKLPRVTYGEEPDDKFLG